jgi:hypothetical protein
VPLESVVNALRRVHSAVVPEGLVLDMQPFAARPPVEAEGARLGTLDMREWAALVADVAELVDETIASGLFREEGSRRYEVLETFHDGTEFVETVSDWTGTKISRSLAARAKRVAPPLVIRESVRLRLLRTL